MDGIGVPRVVMTVKTTRLRKSGQKQIIGGRSLRHKERPVAVFDIDGTIFRSSLAIELLHELIDIGIFPKNAKQGYERELLAWRKRKGSYENYINKVVAVLWGNLKGVKSGVVERAAEKVLQSKRFYTYRYTRDLAKSLKKKGYFLLAISHSPRVILGPFAKRFGFDEAYGSLAETDAKGKLTGNPKNFHLIKDKGGILLRARLRHGFTLKKSIGVGDTESDISFLKLVQYPLCFNPNMKLYREAQKRGWKIVVERKDVMYDGVRAKKVR